MMPGARVVWPARERFSLWETEQPSNPNWPTAIPSGRASPGEWYGGVTVTDTLGNSYYAIPIADAAGKGPAFSGTSSIGCGLNMQRPARATMQLYTSVVLAEPCNLSYTWRAASTTHSDLSQSPDVAQWPSPTQPTPPFFGSN